VKTRLLNIPQISQFLFKISMKKHGFCGVLSLDRKRRFVVYYLWSQSTVGACLSGQDKQATAGVTALGGFFTQIFI
jgi:hypothetical protein